jgi:hypothetical protein
MVQPTAQQAMSGRQAAASPGKEFGDGPTRRRVAMMAPVVPPPGRLAGDTGARLPDRLTREVIATDHVGAGMARKHDLLAQCAHHGGA